MDKNTTYRKSVRRLGESLYSSSSNHILRAAILQMQSGDVDEALTMFDRAAGLYPGEWRIPLLMAWLLFTRKRIEEAEQQFGKALALAADNPEVLRIYAHFVLDCGDSTKALRYLCMTAALEPEDASLHCEIGYVHHVLGDNAAAEESFRRALSFDADQSASLLNLGIILSWRNEATEVADIVRKLVELGHDDEAEILRTMPGGVAKSSAPEDASGQFAIAHKMFRIAPFRMQSAPPCATSACLGLSVIVPIMDEKDNLPVLYQEIADALKEMDRTWEIIFIDDGSTDGSLEVIEGLAAKDPRVRGVVFRRNYGQTAALSAGFQVAQGEVVISMDGDLQNDPADIPMFLAKMAEGYDMVCGWRKDRQDKLFTRRIPSKIANWIINWLISGTGIKINDFGCSLKAYKLDIVKNIKLYGEMHRFIPVFAAWLGVNMAEVVVNHRPRTMGLTKYNLSRVWKVLFDLLPLRFFSDYMTRPIHFFGKIAKLLFGAGVVGCGLLGISAALFELPQWVFSLATLLSVIGVGSLTIVCMGMIGEIAIRIYFEMQNKDQFVIERIVNGSDA